MTMNSFLQARAALDRFVADPTAMAAVEAIVMALARVLRPAGEPRGDGNGAAAGRGGTILICGNGGSACDAAHFAEELTGKFRADRPPLAALACTDPGHLTCVANDYGFERVFSRWVEALGRPGDALIVLSTSGRSKNILRAIESAKALGLITVALIGRDGGELRGRCTHEVLVPGEASDRIQELHMLILHVLVERIEQVLGYAT
ncbi:MAG: SIS domain-containing protein [Phycisphaerae bacterium]|nr:SIS domain-containing protein [Phycisphaerae bacterium]